MTYEYSQELSYHESVDYKGDRGAYLAPDECCACWFQNSELVWNCQKHVDPLAWNSQEKHSM